MSNPLDTLWRSSRRYFVIFQISRSLKIGKNSDIIDAKQNRGNQLQITVVEELLKKTEETLKQHVKYRYPEIASKDEVDTLGNQKDLIESIQKQLHHLPSSIEGMEEQLDTINQIRSQHQRISVSVDAAQSKVGDFHQEALASSSDVTYFSNQD